MIITCEKDLRNFDFWGGAKSTAAALTCEQLDTIEAYLEDIYPEGMDEVTVNDFFWFEEDTIASWLGFRDWDDLLNDGEDEEDEDEEDEDEEDELDKRGNIKE